ncbi:MAG: cell division protein FtsA, partial [Anaerolineaceae bacterium]|nr:cell division protein FtsA [Anaerolineaceae bacterium]
EQVSRKDLANIIEARVEEIFQLVQQEIKRSGYDGLLPAGMVLTGGSSLLPGIRNIASQVTGLPVRVARPENLVGLVDQLQSPAYSTSVGLLRWAMLMNQVMEPKAKMHLPRGINPVWIDKMRDFAKRMLP